MKWSMRNAIILNLLLYSVHALQNGGISDQMGRNSSRILSRKRRYLVFPEGSSLQLVFCLTMPSLGMGKIFTLGSTAALAWQLPHEPITSFKKPAEAQQRLDEHPAKAPNVWNSDRRKLPLSVTYYDPFSIYNKSPNPEFYQSWKFERNGNMHPRNRYYNFQKFSRADYPETRRVYQGGMKMGPVMAYVDPVYHEVYRRTRRDVYPKIEKLLTALNRDGRACLLKAICEVSKIVSRKGTFIEEIIKAIFRIKPHDDYPDEDDYDKAANKNHNCSERYQSCPDSILKGIFF